MTRGRKPDPGAEKRGTRKRPSTSRAPSQALALPDELALARPAAPDDLDPVLVPIWDAIMDDLGSRGANPSAFRAVDVVLIRTLVDAIGLHKQATERIACDGLITTSRFGEPVVNPLVRVQKDAAATILRLTDSLGLNPAARVRLGVMQLAGQSILASLQKMMDEAT